MEANELRVNNIVSIIGRPSGERFNYSLPNGQSIDMIFVKRNNHDPEPIPLTEEWLVKFGFTCHWDDDYDNHVFSLIRSGNYDDVIIDPSWVSQTECNRFVIAHFDYEMDLEIKHVHQLQNLYFALTNEELTIK